MTPASSTGSTAIERDRIRAATDTLSLAGVPSAAHDARRLAEHAAESGTSYDDLIAARAGRVPLQHLTGHAHFRHLDLAVGPGVFIPRPETELLVDAVLAAIVTTEKPVVVDLCAGTGAIGLSVAHEHPNSTVHLVERSAEAFGWLLRNARGYQRVHCHLGDLTAEPAHLDGRVDVVVSNPPYLPLVDRRLVDPEVAEHDPEDALWSGDDGLDTMRRLLPRARVLLRPGGTVIVEHADGQGESVPKLLRDNGFVDIHDHTDLAGRARYAVARQPC